MGKPKLQAVAENLTTKKAAKGALSSGKVPRVSALAKIAFANFAAEQGSKKAGCVAKGANSGARMNGRKTVLLRDVESAIKVLDC